MRGIAFVLLATACAAQPAARRATIPGYLLARDGVAIGFEAHVDIAGHRIELRIAIHRQPNGDIDEKLVRVREDGSWSEIVLPPPPDDQPARVFRVRSEGGQPVLYSIVPTSDYVDPARMVRHEEYRWPLVWDAARDNFVVGGSLLRIRVAPRGSLTP